MYVYEIKFRLKINQWLLHLYQQNLSPSITSPYHLNGNGTTTKIIITQTITTTVAGAGFPTVNLPRPTPIAANRRWCEGLRSPIPTPATLPFR